ncbi:MAG: response regulator [Chromatiaceae bacterium]
MKILIVDDDPLAGELVLALLEEFGHDCQLAENGIAALECLGAGTGFELVISDLNMPLVSGLELFQELRAQGQEVAFILLTGDDPEPLRAQTPGLSGVLRKDADLEETLPALVASLAGD